MKKEGKIFRTMKYFSAFMVALAVFALGNFWCYKSAVKHFDELQQQTQDEMSEDMQIFVTSEIEKKYSQFKDEYEQEQSVSADTTDEDKLGVGTVYQVESYDVVNDSTTTDYETLPESLVECSKDEVADYCRKYIENMSVDEYLAGLQSMGVVSYSSERLVVKKVYDSSKIEYKYYLIVVDGEVVVYYGDKKTVYEYTGIESSGLGKKERQALKNGIEVKDESELYSILENYSS